MRKSSETPTIGFNFISAQQLQLFKKIAQPIDVPEAFYVYGGSNSGKTYGVGLACAYLASICEGIRIIICHTNRTALTSIYTPPIEAYFAAMGWDKAIKSTELNKINKESGKPNAYILKNGVNFTLFNNSTIDLIVLDQPIPSHNNKVHGLGANMVVLDEGGSNMRFEWFDYFLTGRLRRSPKQNCEFTNRVVVTDNTDPRAWAADFFVRKRHPKTLTPHSADMLKRIAAHKVDTWNNRLISSSSLELMKTGGNTTRFYYSDITLVQDVDTILPYKEIDADLRYFYVYGMDFGHKAYTTLVQVGYGGDYTVSARELYRKQGKDKDEILALVNRLLAYHEKMLQLIASNTPQNLGSLLKLQLTPVLVIDCANPELGEAISKRFGSRIIVKLSDKAGTKYGRMQKLSMLKLQVLKSSQFFRKELDNYRYQSIAYDTEERIRDGDDDLIDAYSYAAVEALQMLKIETKRLYFPAEIKNHFEMLKKANITCTSVEF